ncbi:hypothetical protein SAMN04489712_1277 [Thermomonospora echinospora]|uniref:Uncharacterized protein n=1 Tax=Thermomonospora echinospora TaxID=1992 RepID=A0A1H6DZ98_9ACTN|nr:hypothetical protein [Thermomonospora echinospora]SEG90680.1 hypothetical protein SAMN04489712_1277 [Thermomonospora echinospora]
MAAFKKPFGFQPLEQQLAQRQAEQEARKPAQGKYFDHPTAKYVFIALTVVTVLAHVIALVVFGIMGLH